MKRECINCQADFEISESDQEFYTSMEVPTPSHCYFCRMQRRLSYRNERFLFHRKCDLSGKAMVSAFNLNSPFPVYDIDTWWGDDWNALDYGIDFDPALSFQEQFVQLRNSVPRLALQQQRPMENSEYCNCASHNKNCYLVFSTNYCEDCYYGSWVNSSRDCLDNLTIESCELCYECVGCRDSYNLRYSRDCIACTDSMLLRDCIGCKNCFGCTSLAQQEYCLFNEPIGKKKYEEFLSSINSGSFSTIEDLRNQVEQALGVTVVKELHGLNLEDCVGDYLRNCRNCTDCFEVDHSEDLRYCMCLSETKSSMDFSYWGKNAERIYECQACGYDVFNLRFCNLCWSGCSDLTYCDHCFASSNCFGCVGLRNAEYCIFNKQYSKEDYNKLKAEVVEHMKRTGEWGEYFPVSISPFAYNETLAMEHAPMNKAQAEAKGWPWNDELEEKANAYVGPKVEVPDDIAEATIEICNKILKCEQTGRPFKIIEAEFEYYKSHNIPLPRICPDARHARRLMLRNPRLTWERECAECKSNIKTSYAPSRPEKVLCEGCYQEQVYS